MEDHHVDRPGVEAQQCVQLTGTNRSFGLIALICQCASHSIRNAKASDKNGPSGPARFALAASRGGKTKRPRRQYETHFASLRPLPAWWLSARRSDPIPSRTRPSNASAPMVLCLKTRESRSSPGLQRTDAKRQKTASSSFVRKRRPRARSKRREKGGRHAPGPGRRLGRTPSWGL